MKAEKAFSKKCSILIDIIIVFTPIARPLRQGHKEEEGKDNEDEDRRKGSRPLRSCRYPPRRPRPVHFLPFSTGNSSLFTRQTGEE